VGSALVRRLRVEGFADLILRTHAELDLERQADVEAFFEGERPELVFLAAAKVGGIGANEAYPAEFLHRNLAIQTHVIHAAWSSRVRRLIFLGSSCVYPRACPQPMREEHLLTGPLEPTNRPYAVAKIAGIVACEAYNRQHGARFLAVMPTNLYGPNDNFDLETSHVLPALIRKFHLARLASMGDGDGLLADRRRFGPIPEDFLACLVAVARAKGHPEIRSMAPELGPVAFRGGAGTARPRPHRDAAAAVALWGTGAARREFLHVDDLAAACVFLMGLPPREFDSLVFPRPAGDGPSSPFPLINIGCGEDRSVRDLAALAARVVGYEGEVVWDGSRPDGTPRKLLDVSRMKGMGWRPRIDLSTGMKETYAWYCSQLSTA
jgi:GDP-L-fucose synthase